MTYSSGISKVEAAIDHFSLSPLFAGRGLG
jgi:hypothetical protein